MVSLEKIPKNPKEIVKKLANAAKPIEYFADKIPDKSLRGLFYAMVVLFLLCLFATFIILAIIRLEKFFPDQYKWIIIPIILIILGGLLIFFLLSVATSTKREDNNQS